MPDYLGEDQRKTKIKDEKDDDKPIKGMIIELISPSCLLSMIFSNFSS